MTALTTGRPSLRHARLRSARCATWSGRVRWSVTSPTRLHGIIGQVLQPCRPLHAPGGLVAPVPQFEALVVEDGVDARHEHDVAGVRGVEADLGELVLASGQG